MIRLNRVSLLWAVLLMLLVACGGGQGGAPGPGGPGGGGMPTPEISVAVVPERDITEWDEYTGRLEAVDTVEIRPQVSGYLQKAV